MTQPNDQATYRRRARRSLAAMLIAAMALGSGCSSVDQRSNDSGSPIATNPERAPGTLATTTSSTASTMSTRSSTTTTTTTVSTTTTISTTTLPPLRPVGVAAPLRAWVGGDSLPAYIITALNGGSADPQLLELTYDARISTSIVRPSYLDWQQQLSSVLDAESPPEAVVFMIGGNDNQPMTDTNGDKLATLSPEWQTEYRRRVATLMDLTDRPGTSMLWIGLPPPRDGIRLQLNPTLNAIFETEADRRSWVTFLDIDPLLREADGNYAARLPGPGGGDLVTARPRDGVHITLAASRWIADLVWTWMLDTWSIPLTASVTTTE